MLLGIRFLDCTRIALALLAINHRETKDKGSHALQENLIGLAIARVLSASVDLLPDVVSHNSVHIPKTVVVEVTAEVAAEVSIVKVTAVTAAVAVAIAATAGVQAKAGLGTRTLGKSETIQNLAVIMAIALAMIPAMTMAIMLVVSPITFMAIMLAASLATTLAVMLVASLVMTVAIMWMANRVMTVAIMSARTRR